MDEVDSIEIPAEEFEGQIVNSRTDFTLNLEEYLPNGVQLADSMANSMIITIAIERNGTRNYELPIGSITVKNLDDDLRMHYTKTEDLEVHVRGAKESLEELNIERMAVIDLKEYQKAGTYTVPVKIELPEDCSLEGIVTVEIILEKKENGG